MKFFNLYACVMATMRARDKTFVEEVEVGAVFRTQQVRHFASASDLPIFFSLRKDLEIDQIFLAISHKFLDLIRFLTILDDNERHGHENVQKDRTGIVEKTFLKLLVRFFQSRDKIGQRVKRSRSCVFGITNRGLKIVAK